MPANLKALLPPNSSQLERLVSEALADIQHLNVPLRQIWNPQTCPAHLLPYLAWAFSIDRWDTQWSEATQRAVIADAFYVHQHKGTTSALRRVVEPLGYLLEVKEWWQTEPPGARGTFALKIGILDTGINDEMYDELIRLIDNAKPLTRHITGLDLTGESRGTFYLGCAMYDGDVTAVLPFIAEENQTNGRFYVAVAINSYDTATVYPLTP